MQKEAAVEMEFCKQSNAMTDKDAFGFKRVNPEGNSAMSENMITLDINIADAINKKDTLKSTMDGVLSLLKEVEHREKIAQEAVDKANRTSSSIIAMTEEIKQARQRTKEANEMRVEDIYVQQIVLATSMKKLHFRVSDVLNEEDVSLEDLDKMSISLDKRLTLALEKKKAVDKEELERILALAYEKRLLQKTEEESMRLEQEVRNNIKMQELIISRGHIVDFIEEDVSCRCQHVNLLKGERIDCQVDNEVFDNEKSLREVEHREKAARIGLGIGANMDEQKQAQRRAKVAEEPVAEASSNVWDFFSNMDKHTCVARGEEEAGENADPHKSENVAKEPLKKVSKTDLDIFSIIDEHKHGQKRAEEVNEADNTDLDNLAKMAEPRPTQNRVRKDDVEGYFSLTPIIQETISGWDEKEAISNGIVFRSSKSSIKDNKCIKRSLTLSKNKVTKKWINGVIKEAVAEYENDDFDRYERLYGCSYNGTN